MLIRQGQRRIREHSFSEILCRTSGAGERSEKSREKPVRSWVFQTDAKAVCRYQEKYKVKGDALYKATDGTEALPLGTVTIQEIKPPKGYFLNEEVFVCQIKPKVREKK